MKQVFNFHDFIAQLPSHIQEEMRQLSSIRLYKDSERIYSQGEQPNEMYHILDGSVKVCNYSYDGKEVVFARLQHGDCFGEIGIIDGLQRINYAVAIGTTRLRVINKKNFDILYYKYPEISQQINLMLCRRFRMAMSISEDASLLSLNQRLARLIHRLVFSHGKLIENNTAYCIDISQEELGNMLGATRQSISKELKKLEDDGIIKLKYGKVMVTDLEPLHQIYDKLMGAEPITAAYRDESNPSEQSRGVGSAQDKAKDQEPPLRD